MHEVKEICKEKRDLEIERLKLSLTEARYTIPTSAFLFVCGVETDSISLITLAFALAALPALPVLNRVDTNLLKKENEEARFQKASQLHHSVQRGVRNAFRQLKNETDPKKRQEIMASIRWMKSVDVIRQSDKEEVMSLCGRKRKGLALGLKSLRKQVGTTSKEVYDRRRENILSYY